MYFNLLENEYWWGGVVNKGIDAPYSAEKGDDIDIYKFRDSLDQCAPVFVSSKGRYLWSEKPFKISFWGNEARAYGESKIVLVQSEGDNLKSACLAIAKDHYKLGEIPDELFLNVPQYNTWIEFGSNQTQEKILDYAHKIVETGMSTGILMIDASWHQTLGDWEFNQETFPNPKAMVDELHELGFKVMLWTVPIVRDTAKSFEILKEKGYLLKQQDGKIAYRAWWSGSDPVLDLTNPDALKWYTDTLDGLMEKYGIDGFKLDAGDMYFYDSHDLMANPVNCAEHTKIFNSLGYKYRFHEFRAGYNCGGEPIVFRLQDKTHTWDGFGLNCLIPHSITQGLIGHFYHCPDMVGGGALNELFDTCFDQELYVRWVQANALCPMMQFSLAPWRVLSLENFEIVKKMGALHKKYGEYIVSLARHASQTGEPIMRHMAYEFPKEGFEKIDDQFMLGDKILVAPVLEKGKTSRNVKLPEGKWSLFGKEIPGGKTLEFDAPLDTLLYFEKM